MREKTAQLGKSGKTYELPRSSQGVSTAGATNSPLFVQELFPGLPSVDMNIGEARL